MFDLVSNNVKQVFSCVIDYNNANHTKYIREVRVKCLQSIADLKHVCKKLGLKFNDYYSKEVMKVDIILEDKILNCQRLYLVKWQDYDSEYNTWEPSDNLIDCEDLIYFYNAMKEPPTELSEEMIFYFIKDLLTRKPHDLLTLTKLCALIFKVDEDHINSLQLSFADLRKKATNVLNIPVVKLNKIRDELLNLMQFSEKRKLVLLSIKEWEIKINKNTSPYTKVENNIDLEGPPSNFNFVDNYISSYIDLTPRPVIYCSCVDCSKNQNYCCSHYWGGDFAYDKQQRIQLLAGYAIYECNEFCKCDKNCLNRVVQHGQKIRVAIFRTSNGCGWGLKTLELIQKSQFVLEYIGEVISSSHAERRGEVYDHLGRTYLFDLDFEKDCLYTVDSMLYGNASRFINHSCNPNLETYSVWSSQQHPNLPRIAFFAKKKIMPGEELTFDYKMVDSRGKNGIPIPENERILCKCNSKNCKTYLF